MTDPLHDKIRRAQIAAGERAVVDFLNESGLVRPRPKERGARTAQDFSHLDFDDLLRIALAVNDALRIEVDHAVYEGSTDLALEFREIVNRAWHRSWLSDEKPPSP
jgi:hypothetical protein